jgi:hypothetical protein
MKYNIPQFLSYYFRKNQEPFQVLSELDENKAEAILKNDVQWRGDGTYLKHRIQHEEIIKNKFIEKGGRPKRKYPIYAILGESPIGPFDMENEYEQKIIIPVDQFNPEDISFTYPDSLYEVPINDIARLYLDRNIEPIVYKIGEMEEIIKQYRVYEIRNHYVEAQIWNDQNIQKYKDTKYWIQCEKR